MGINAGDKFRPLPNSKRYGPKYWQKDSDGVYCEFEPTALDLLAHDIAWADSLFERTTPTPGGEFAVFPSVPHFPVGSAKQRKLESAWQVKAEIMHSKQTAIIPEAKPVENVLKARKDLVRGD